MMILDRFEEDFGVIEIEDEIINVKRSQIDNSVKEGDVLKLVEGIYYIDFEATEARRKYIEDKFKDMWED